MRLIMYCLSTLILCISAQASDFTLNTQDFSIRGLLPQEYTCDGADVSPELEWQNPPPNTKAFAIVLNDPDAKKGNFYHWIIYNIPKNVTTLKHGMNPLPQGTVVVTNSFGKAQYNGPCPPQGATHNYIFNIYALKQPLSLPANADISTVLQEITKQTIDSTYVSVIYSH